MMAVNDDYEEVADNISFNITHNMAEMARHIPCIYNIGNQVWSSNLYLICWRPDEVSDCGICNTNIILDALRSGIYHMILMRKELLQYNPTNLWGSYDSFLNWLIAYSNACEDNPFCEIEVER